MAGAEVTVTTGAIPAVSLAVTRLPDPVWPFTVCEAVTRTASSGKPLTSIAAVDQIPLLHTGNGTAATSPTCTVTSAPYAEQVPETV